MKKIKIWLFFLSVMRSKLNFNYIGNILSDYRAARVFIGRRAVSAINGMRVHTPLQGGQR